MVGLRTNRKDGTMIAAEKGATSSKGTQVTKYNQQRTGSGLTTARITILRPTVPVSKITTGKFEEEYIKVIGGLTVI